MLVAGADSSADLCVCGSVFISEWNFNQARNVDVWVSDAALLCPVLNFACGGLLMVCWSGELSSPHGVAFLTAITRISVHAPISQSLNSG